MKFIVKYFPEITIKSKPVRRQFVSLLRKNLRTLIRAVDEAAEVQSDWDKIIVETQGDDEQLRQQIIDVLSSTPGIAHVLDVVEFPFVDKHDAFEKTQQLWGDRLLGKTFVVRAKRVGKHDFSSHELEQYTPGRAPP